MPRFYLPQVRLKDNEIIILDTAMLHHLHVLRLKPQEALEIFDQGQNLYSCRIKRLEKERAVLRLVCRRREKKEAINLAVACAIPKNSKFEDIVAKLAQLGVSWIIPLKTERVIVKLDAQKEELRLKRWRKIAEAASQQSRRSSLPVIGPIMEMKGALEETDSFALRLIPHLSGKRRPLKEVIAGSRANSIAVFIGPEGDFAPGELRVALQAGCIPVSLGPLVLRVETAAVAVASYIGLSLSPDA
jgi:16S rRNA (uracil1498-N3)-methyltransferase